MSDYAKLNASPQLVEKKEIIGIYDYDVHGGAVDTSGIELSDLFGINPGEALRVTKVFVIDAATSGTSSATLSFGTESTDPDNILDDTAVSSLTEHAVIDGVQVPQTGSTWIVNSGSTFLKIKAQVKTEALTAGKVAVIAEIIKLPEYV